LKIFRKYFEKAKLSSKSDKNIGAVLQPFVHLCIAQFFLELEMFQIAVVEKIKKKPFTFSYFFF